MLRKGGEKGIQITLHNKSRVEALKAGGGQAFFLNLVNTVSSLVLSWEYGFSAGFSEERAPVWNRTAAHTYLPALPP